MNVGSGERTAAALRAGRFPPVEGQCGSCVSAVQGSDVECKAAMLRQKGNMKCRQRERTAAELSAGLSMAVENRRVLRVCTRQRC